MNRRTCRQVILGAGSLVLLIMILLLSWYMDRSGAGIPGNDGEKEVIRFHFQPQVLTYDGTGQLDLMEGVTAVTDQGTDLTGSVEAVLTADEEGRKKKIRYTVYTSSGVQETATRLLELVDYQGPRLQVEDPLYLNAEDLDRLTEVLKERGELTADDGFSGDASGEVTWVRMRQGNGIYTITFTLRNDYLDERTCSVQAVIQGEVSDISLELSASTVTISAGSGFDPLEYLETARDPETGDLMDRLQISGTVDTANPGYYHVVYTLYSLDGTQKAEEVLTVEVTE